MDTGDTQKIRDITMDTGDTQKIRDITMDQEDMGENRTTVNGSICCGPLC